MKIALIGSAPSSIKLAPFNDPNWEIWGVSPGAWAQGAQVATTWFELHRWEPGLIGRPDTQKPWLSPEYVAWLRAHRDVVMVEPHPDVPNSRPLPWQALISIYGAYFFNSSLSWMFAMAIEKIKDDRANRDTPPVEKWDDAIGMWGVDMSATEEYGYQRAGCQFFIQLASNMNIKVVIPPESDILRHSPLYGVCEHWEQHIKLLSRLNELNARHNAANTAMLNAQREVHYTKGLIDELNYQINTWLNVPEIPGFHMRSMFQSSSEREATNAEMAATTSQVNKLQKEIEERAKELHQSLAQGSKSIDESLKGAPTPRANVGDQASTGMANRRIQLEGADGAKRS